MSTPVREPLHDRACVLSTGDEIITGQLQDTNARFCSQSLIDAGILPVEHACVPDELAALVGTLRRLCHAAPLVVMTGGLGPTDGDLTRAALGEILGEPLVLDEDARAALELYLRSRGREMSERQRRQAYRPASARCLDNPLGTAPGLHTRVPVSAPHGLADVYCLPGPPGEMRPMWDNHVRPALRTDPARVILTRLVHIAGLPEADAVTRLGDLTRRDANPLVGITASGGILTLRIRFDACASADEARAAVDAAEARARAVLGDHVVAAGPGPGPERLAGALIDRLTASGRTLASVESCTGGMLGEMLTRVPGSSSAYVGGFVTYANRLKRALGVGEQTLTEHGAVSAQCAIELARRGLDRTAADHCLSLTGIAGPGGGSADKPVGTVHIALASRDAGANGGDVRIDTRRFMFPGDREAVRTRACVSALAMLHFGLLGRASGEPRLPWQGA